MPLAELIADVREMTLFELLEAAVAYGVAALISALVFGAVLFGMWSFLR